MKTAQIVLILFIIFAAIDHFCFAQLLDPDPLARDCHQQLETKKAQNEVTVPNQNYWKGYPADIKKILISPLHWKKHDWLNASLIIAITAGLYTQDQEIQSWTQNHRNKTSDAISRFAKPFGDGRYTLPPLAISFLYGHFFHDHKAERIFALGLESFVISGIFTAALKATGHRHRPNVGDPYDSWDGPGLSSANVSFPSGHSSSAFAIAAVVASEYHKAFIVPLALGIAGLTAFSRVNDNAHWSSDAFLGSAIGYFTAKATIRLHQRYKTCGFAFLPATIGDHVGFVVSYQF